MTRSVGAIPMLAGLGGALAVFLAIRATHAWLVPDVPIAPPWTNGVALVVTALALARSWAVRPRAGRTRLTPAVATGTATALAALSVAVYANLGTVQLPYHRWDQFHYFIGAKYFPELGYTRLYQCTAVAEAERFGRTQVARRAIPVAMAARRWRHTGYLAPAHRRFALGLILGGAFWFVTATGLFGWGAWPAFVAHMAHHRAAPLANDVGLRALLSQSIDGRLARTEDDRAVDPFQTWKERRRETFTTRRSAYLLLVAGVAGLVVGASARVRRLWCALAGSVVAIAALVDLASYYYALVVLLALLAATGEPRSGWRSVRWSSAGS